MATDNSLTGTLTSTVETSTIGLDSWQITPAGTTHTQTTYSGGGNRTVTVTGPDETKTITGYTNGLVA